MFRINPHFEQIPDETVLWRYMPFDRLRSLIERGAIFFPKVTVYEEDPFEGSYNKLSEESYIRWMLSDSPRDTYENVSSNVKRHLDSKVATSLGFAEKFKDLAIISCWHINSYESVAMWKLYSSFENGVAIYTTYGNLKRSLEEYSKPIYGGKVRYIDIHKDAISFGNVLAPFASKRMSFSYENELRLVTIVDHDNHFSYDWQAEEFKVGKFIPCNINELILKIYTSPKCSDAFLEELDDFLLSNGVFVEIVRSDVLKLN